MTTSCAACLPTLAGSATILAAFYGLLIVAAVKDVRSMTIPNGISLAMAALYPVHVLVSGADWIDGMVAGGSVFAVGIALFALGWLGGGDVKLLAASSLWAGTSLLLPALFVTALAGGLLCAFIWVRRGGPSRILQRLSAGSAPVTGQADGLSGSASGDRAAVVPYAVAILAGGTLVAIVQFLPIWRLAETAL